MGSFKPEFKLKIQNQNFTIYKGLKGYFFYYVGTYVCFLRKMLLDATKYYTDAVEVTRGLFNKLKISTPKLS